MAVYDDAVEDYRGGDLLGAGTSAIWELFKFSAGWESLQILRDAPTQGYYLPTTRKGLIAKAGRKMKLWGAGGKMLAPPMDPTLYRYFRRGGISRMFGKTGTIAKASKHFGKNAAQKAAAKYITGRVAGVAIPVIGTYFAVEAAVGIGKFAYDTAAALTDKYKGIEMGGYFPDSQAAYTSRQRAVRAITASQMQARSAIGMEAQLFHR